MSEIRKKIENNFETFGRAIYRHRIKTLVIMMMFIAAMASGTRKISFDTSTEALLHHDDPILFTYNEFRDQFGRDEMIVLAIETPEVFEQGFLKKLKALHQDLETKVPHLDEVNSLINARNTRGEADTLIVEDLLENWPKDDGELEALKQRVLANEFYKNLLISEDAGFTAVMIKTSSYSSTGEPIDALDGFDDFQDGPSSATKSEAPVYLTDKENSEVVNAVREVVAGYNGSGFQITMAGSPVITNDLKRSMIKDARRFILAAAALVGLLLSILFRRVTGVLLPMVAVILSLVSTIGLMGHLGVALKLPSNVLPSFLLAVGVGDAVHILTIFYRRLSFNDSKEDAIAYALGHSGLAVSMTTLTTAAGLFSFYAAEVAAISELGVFAGFGVLLAMIYTLILLPALLALVPVKNKKLIDPLNAEGTILDRFLVSIGNMAINNPYKVIIISGLILTGALLGALQNRFTHNVLKWFPDDMEIRLGTEKIDEYMKGATVLEVVIDTGKEEGLYAPEILNKLEEMKKYSEAYTQKGLFVGKTMTVTDILKEIHQALNENRPEYYAVPQEADLIPQEFLLFENSGADDLEDFVDSQFSKARFTLKVPWCDAIVYDDFIKTINNKFNEKFAGQAEITVTGLACILGRTLSATIRSMAKSYLIAFIVITCLMILLIGDLKIGLVSMIPNLSPIVIAMGIIGVTNIPLDMFTMLVGSVAIGLAVDDTIHFMHNFRRYHYETGKVAEAVHMTLQTTGRAMLFTSMVLASGFFVLMLSKMHNLTNFGLLTGITIILALLADFLLAPALMTVIYGRKESQDI